MKKKFSSILFLSAIFFLFSNSKKNEKSTGKPYEPGRWTGTVTMEQTTIISAPGWTGRSDKKVVCTFVDALPTMYRDDPTTDFSNFTDNKGKGSYSFHSEGTIAGVKGVTDCNGSGEAELHAVTINESDHTYDIEVIGPACNGTTTGEDGGTQAYGPDNDDDITITHALGPNVNSLDGSTTGTAKDPTGWGTVTTTVSWHLTRLPSDDVELIVTPVDYDKWLPEPGINEMFKGSVMTINLKLQGKNGKPLKVKAESFELRLNNTSTEPGITINYPIEPDPKQLPDLRFLLLPNIESEDEDQFISISSPDGITGKTYIASYDGGGWTTLTVEAILEDKRHIQGKLLVANGEADIRIPKREPNSKIGEAWSKKYNNPGEMDDKESSNGNNNKGDGLTAYEEYRGVISQGKFKRLDPQKKELGIRVEKSELPLFAEGIHLFKIASNIETVIFFQDEIGFDGRLNKNFSAAHDFDQCALILKKAPLPYLVGGNTYTTTDAPAIPSQTLEIDVDVEQIHTIIYQYLTQLFGPLNCSSSDLITATVAHELCHGVNVVHHGDKETLSSPQIVSDSAKYVKYQIFDKNGNIISARPFVLAGPIGVQNNETSGDLSCVIAYNPYFKWAYHKENGFEFFYEVPLIPIGRQLCNSRVGTGINTPSPNPAVINKYFGKASNGNCLNQIKLR